MTILYCRNCSGKCVKNGKERSGKQRYVPKRNWFMEMFGNQTDISGVSDGVEWQIKDASIDPSHENNITRIGSESRSTKYSPMVIRAYRYQMVGVFSLMFSDYSTYLEYCKYIGIEPKYELP